MPERQREQQGAVPMIPPSLPRGRADPGSTGCRLSSEGKGLRKSHLQDGNLRRVGATARCSTSASPSPRPSLHPPASNRSGCCGAQHLRVGLKGHAPILEGELPAAVGVLRFNYRPPCANGRP